MRQYIEIGFAVVCFAMIVLVIKIGVYEDAIFRIWAEIPELQSLYPGG